MQLGTLHLDSNGGDILCGVEPHCLLYFFKIHCDLTSSSYDEMFNTLRQFNKALLCVHNQLGQRKRECYQLAENHSLQSGYVLSTMNLSVAVAGPMTNVQHSDK